MPRARTDLAAINDELNALEWDPPLRRYRIRSRVVTGAPRRTFYVQKLNGYIDGRESWRIVARSYKRALAEAFVSQAMGKPR